MRVRYEVAQLRNSQETAHDDDLRVERIGERSRGVQIGAVGGIALSRVGEFAEYGQTCACASNGNAAMNGVVQRALHGSIAPEIDVVRLISAGDKNGRCGAYRSCDKRVIGSITTGNNQRGGRTYVAKRLDVRIVGVGAARANHKKVPTAGPSAKPHEGLVQIGTAANQCIAWVRSHMDVMGISDAEVAVGRRVRSANAGAGRKHCSTNEREGKDKSQAFDA